MATSRALELKILGNVDSLNKSLKSAQDQVNGAGRNIEKSFDQVKRAVTLASVAVVGFAAAFGKQAVQAASDLNETISKSQVIFEDNAAAIEDWGKTASSAFGQSQRQALDAAANFAIFGKAAGLAGSDLTTFSTDFVELASDLASFNNTSPEQAITAIGAALRGEAEPIRQYGVLLNEASLRQAALELGIVKTTTQALTPQQRVLAAQKLIFEQTSLAQGDFARTSNGLANQTRILKAELENVTAEIGVKLLPYILQITKFISEKAIPFFKEYQKVIEKLATVTVSLASGVLVLNAVIKGYQAAIVLATVATGIFNAVLAANPLTLVAAGIAAVIAAFIILEARTGFLRKAWEFLTDAVKAALDWFKRVANFFGAEFETAAMKHEATIKRNVEVWDESRRAANKVQDNLRQGVLPAFKDADRVIKDTGSSADETAGKFDRLAGSANNAAAGVKALSAAQAALQKETAALQAGGAIPSAISPDLKNFYKSELGLISQFGGFIEGINLLPTDPFFGFGQGSNVSKALQQRAGGSATATGGVTINVSGTVIDPEGAARAIEQLISDSNARGGALFSDLFGINP